MRKLILAATAVLSLAATAAHAANAPISRFDGVYAVTSTPDPGSAWGCQGKSWTITVRGGSFTVAGGQAVSIEANGSTRFTGSVITGVRGETSRVAQTWQFGDGTVSAVTSWQFGAYGPSKSCTWRVNGMRTGA